MPAIQRPAIGRPPGEFRLLVRAALAGGEGTVRQIAERTGLSICAARTTLDNARRAGEVHVVRYEHAAHGRRWRSPVYAQAIISQGEAQAADDGAAQLAAMLGQVWR